MTKTHFEKRLVAFVLFFALLMAQMPVTALAASTRSADVSKAGRLLLSK